jgi:hypothetical protein
VNPKGNVHLAVKALKKAGASEHEQVMEMKVAEATGAHNTLIYQERAVGELQFKTTNEFIDEDTLEDRRGRLEEEPDDKRKGRKRAKLGELGPQNRGAPPASPVAATAASRGGFSCLPDSLGCSLGSALVKPKAVQKKKRQGLKDRQPGRAELEEPLHRDVSPVADVGVLVGSPKQWVYTLVTQLKGRLGSAEIDSKTADDWKLQVVGGETVMRWK